MTTTVVSSGVCSGNLGGGVQQASVIVAPRCSLSYSLADLKIQRKIYLQQLMFVVMFSMIFNLASRH
jgi:hypothetical protein